MVSPECIFLDEFVGKGKGESEAQEESRIDRFDSAASSVADGKRSAALEDQ